VPFNAASLNAARFELYLEKARPFWAIAAKAAEWSESAAKPFGSPANAANAPSFLDNCAKAAEFCAITPSAEV
jgi:hypothetical protein